MNNYIFHAVEKLIKKHKTRDPFEILQHMGVIVFETDKYQKLKGYCFLSHRTLYVAINEYLSEEEKRIVAAHELGHIILHRSLLCMAPMKDSVLYNMTDKTEYEANLFASDLLLPDDDVFDITHKSDLDYFGLCSTLNTTPELMSFKLYSLIRRGNNEYQIPIGIDSKFLGK